MATKLYLVGDSNADKTNSWLAMTNDGQKAAELLASLEGAAQIKSIKIPEGEQKK